MQNTFYVMVVCLYPIKIPKNAFISSMLISLGSLIFGNFLFFKIYQYFFEFSAIIYNKSSEK